MTVTLTPPPEAPHAASVQLSPAPAPAESGRAHILVVGNEKGGSGKSTAAMHIAVALAREGARVATIDCDARQGTLTRYVENRRTFAAARRISLPTPALWPVAISTLPERGAAEADERARFEAAVAGLAPNHDLIVVDTPGSDTHLSRLAHTWADTLLTPLNDSFVDLDLLARVEPDTFRIVRPSVYSEAVWRQRQERAMRRGRPVDWIVARNRLSNTMARNKRDMGVVLEALAKRLSFRLAPGLSERVIYRELFLKGLTLLDLREEAVGIAMTMSHVAARQEVRDLVEALRLPWSRPQPQEEAAEPEASA
jgi:chromosome partitioning protein